MSVINGYRQADDIFRRVWRVRDLWRALTVVRGVLVYLGLAAGALLLATGLEGFLHTGPAVRSGLLALVAGTFLIGLLICVLRPAFRDASHSVATRTTGPRTAFALTHMPLAVQ